jgi:hypothetical protein
MTDFVRELETRYPSHEEIDQLVREARNLRAKAMRQGAVGILEMMQRAFSRKPAPSTVFQS